MKTGYMIIILVCLSQLLTAQTLNIYKTDNTSLNFSLSEIDSVSFSTTPGGSVINSANWICYTNNNPLSKVALAEGIFEESPEGLKVFGTTNNTAVRLMPAVKCSITSKTVFLKWMVNGSLRPVAIGVELFAGEENLISAAKVLSLSTNLGVIADNTWYYTRISVGEGKIVTVTAKENYDSRGGEVIANTSTVISKEVNNFSFQTMTDKFSYSILAESRIE